MRTHVLNAVMHLASTLPQDPGIDRTMFSSGFTPNYEQAIELAHRIEAVMDPITAIIRTISGKGHPAGAQTLGAAWPATLSELAGQLTFAQPIVGDLTHAQSRGYSMLFNHPMSGLQDPGVVATLQGMYLPQGSPSSPTSQHPTRRPTGGAPGRPAAVQSQVAGSSVSQLIS
jgi:hypothetical protein